MRVFAGKHAATMVDWAGILSFKNGDNFQIVNFLTLPQAIPPRRRVSIRDQDGVTRAHAVIAVSMFVLMVTTPSGASQSCARLKPVSKATRSRNC
jgi:hypothetical protein